MGPLYSINKPRINRSPLNDHHHVEAILNKDQLIKTEKHYQFLAALVQHVSVLNKQKQIEPSLSSTDSEEKVIFRY